MMMLSAFCACADNTPVDTAAVTETDAKVETALNSAEVTTENPYDENGYIKDKLSSDLNFKGTTVRVLYWDDVENQEFFAEDENGNIVNDHIFKRNGRVEDRLNVKLEYIGTKGNWGNYQNFVDTVVNSINAGSTDIYDIAASYSLTAGVCAYRGLVKNLNDLPYLDFSAEWWPSTLLDTSTVNGKLYFASGDISTNLLYMMYAVYYNKEMIEDRKLSDPYSFVGSGEWTIDKMIEISKDVYEDTDRDGVKSDGDTYGQAYYNLHMDAYLYGAGVVTLKQDADGKLAVTEDFASEKMTQLSEKVRSYLFSSDCRVYSNGTYKTNFAAGLSLFITDRADIAVYDLSEKSFDMGILPIPKFDKNQEEYYNVVGNPFTLYQIPTNAANAEAAAAVMECMASESYRLVTPAIFELCMKTRYADGGADVDSYDILRGGVVYDLGRILARVIDTAGAQSPGNMWQAMVKSNTMSWNTCYNNYKKALNKVIDNINDALIK